MIAGLAALGLLAVLFVQSRRMAFLEHARFDAALNQFENLDAALSQNVLKARFHILEDYDGFSDQAAALAGTMRRLHDLPAFVPKAARADLLRQVEDLDKAVGAREELLENFKSQNSVLNNSLSYLPITVNKLILRLSLDSSNSDLVKLLNELMRQVLLYNLGGTDRDSSDIHVSLDKLAEWQGRHPGDADNQTLSSLAAHVKSIVSRKAKVEKLTQALVYSPTDSAIARLHGSYAAQFESALRKADLVRMALYVFCFLLIMGIGYTIYALDRANAQLERRVEERTAALSRNNDELEEEIVRRHAVEENLRTEQAQTEALQDASPLGMFLCGASGDYLRTNETFARIAGFGFDPSHRLDWRNSVHADDLEAVAHEWLEAKNNHRNYQCVQRFVRSNGTIVWTSVKAAPLLDKGILTGFIGTVDDITERKEAERVRLHMEVQLRQAQKLESIGQLAAGIAHEINTPTQFIGDNTRFVLEGFTEINRVLGFNRRLLDAARLGVIDPQLIAEAEAAAKSADIDYLSVEIPKAIAESLQGVQRVAKIVRAMKEFSHPGSEGKTQLDINRAIESTLTVAASEWKYVAEVVTDLDPTLPMVPCLPGEFNQVILNIVVNASHAIAGFVPKGSKGFITLTTRRVGEWVEIRIQDTGGGIPEKIQNRIFDPFFTTKPVGRGTGQGLAIAHSVVVDKHGGTLAFDTEVGRTTTFIIRLPLAAEGEKAKAA